MEPEPQNNVVMPEGTTTEASERREIKDALAAFVEDPSNEALFYALTAEVAKFFIALKDRGVDIIKKENLSDEIFQRLKRSNLESTGHAPRIDPLDVSDTFTYESLTEPTMIRVLLLRCGSGTDPLEGSLSHEMLARAINYEAISYAWGDSSMPCSMLVNGRRMRLTQSLHNALTSLRREKSDRAVWADGVCINQADNIEKSVQVALMPKIFDQGRTLAYLGTESDNSEILPEFLERLSEVDVEMLSKHSAGAETMGTDIPDPDDPGWPALAALLERPWFKRLWVAQEVILANDIRFVCGTWAIRWQLLFHVAEIVNKMQNLLLAHMRDAGDNHRTAAVREAVDHLGVMLGLRLGRSHKISQLADLWRRVKIKSRVDGEDPHALEKREFVVQACKNNPGLFRELERYTLLIPSGRTAGTTPILMLFTMFMASMVTKPQDRLYALVALAGDVGLKDFPPNYEETIEEANARFSRMLVEKGQGLDVLLHATRLTADCPTVPSWTADWTTRRSTHNHWLKLGWAYKCGGFYTRDMSGRRASLVSQDVLRVSGYQLDICTIQPIEFPKMLPDSARTLHIGELWKSLDQTFAMFEGGNYFTGESWSAVRIQTLVAGHTDRIPAEFCSDPEHGTSERMFDEASFNSSVQQGRKSTVAWLLSVADTMSGYAACKTSKGCAGLVPADAVVDDAVFMLEGSNVPFVLRPIPSRPGHYYFVGGCYLHGLMDGKAWEREHTNGAILLV